MRAVTLLAAGIGIAAIAALVAYFGAGEVVHALVTIGLFGFAVICLIHLALIGVMGTAWRALLPGTRWWVPLWGRLVRDSGSEALPLSQVGGYVLGARAIALSGVPATVAAASSIVDITLEFVAQVAYTALGLALLVHLKPDSDAAVPVGIGLGIATLVAIAFLVAQRRAVPVIDRIARALGKGWAERTASGAVALHEALAAIYRNRRGLALSFVMHLACWIAGAAEAWIVLRLAGAPLPFAAVLVIESLLYAARSAAFVVPNAVGVQEGAYIVFGAAFGLSPETALALSLLKRARDLVIGLPAIGAWQIVEGGRLWRRTGKSNSTGKRKSTENRKSPDPDFAAGRAPE
ncbi:MAG TPA: lysylphosphatidylglycerol synthase domain-containing protein [Stellaceae bacterium]|nr:lysylphosphatidylglycerol synthase domain-containing protein [Stellaceae bacterium]